MAIVPVEHISGRERSGQTIDSAFLELRVSRVADSPENQNHPKSADRNNPDAIDLRLAPVAEAVRRGQLIERHWEFFKATHFPEMSEREAGDALFAWAERNGIRATLHQSLAGAAEASARATHVRLSPKNYWGPPLTKSEPA